MSMKYIVLNGSEVMDGTRDVYRCIDKQILYINVFSFDRCIKVENKQTKMKTLAK